MLFEIALPLALLALVLGVLMPRVASWSAAGTGLTAAAALVAQVGLLWIAPKGSNGCALTQTVAYASVFTVFLVGGVAAVIALGSGVAAAIRGEHTGRSLGLGMLGAACGVGCFCFAFAAGFCGD